MTMQIRRSCNERLSDAIALAQNDIRRLSSQELAPVIRKRKKLMGESCQRPLSSRGESEESGHHHIVGQSFTNSCSFAT